MSYPQYGIFYNKRNVILIDVTTWVNLENMLSEKKTATKDHTIYTFIYMECPS